MIASDICMTKVLMPVNVPMKSVGVILNTPRGALIPTIARPMEKRAANKRNIVGCLVMINPEAAMIINKEPMDIDLKEPNLS